MTTRGAKWMLVGVLMISIGMHWALLQSIAWTGMLIRYSQEGRSVATALAMTLDGKHPCKLCRVTESGRRSGLPATQVVPIQKLDPIYVNFNIPQRQLGQLSIGQKISVSVDAFPKAFEGKISAINSEVDASTRNVSVQAILSNPQEQLRAGMFVQVAVELPIGEPQIVLPATAIAYAPYGNSVYVIEQMKGKDGKEYLGVRQQIVKIGATRGDLIAIEEGVKPGEQIVTAGVFKLRNGAPVQLNNAAQPSSSSTPKPANT